MILASSTFLAAEEGSCPLTPSSSSSLAFELVVASSFEKVHLCLGLWGREKVEKLADCTDQECLCC